MKKLTVKKELLAHKPKETMRQKVSALVLGVLGLLLLVPTASVLGQVLAAIFMTFIGNV